MTVINYALLFSLRSLMRLDILAWLICIPLIVLAVVVLWVQYRQHHQLVSDLQQLTKLRSHSVEYDLVMKAMRLAVWRMDVPSSTLEIEIDYRDHTNSISIPPGTKVEDAVAQLLPEYQETVKKGLEDLLAGRVDVFHLQFQVRVPHSDETYWSEGYATVDKRDIQGTPLSVVGTLMRIDQQKDIEKALMDAVYHAEESDRLKTAFLQNISHEIRTPLNAIVGFSEVLTMVEEQEERQNLIALIKQNNTHLLRLFDDIVSMSKLEARGAGTLVKSTFELKEVLQALMVKYKPKADDAGLTLKIEHVDSLPVLTTDRDRLREILNQYLSNALKFTTEGQVTMGCTEYDGKWRVWVKDTGKGIPEDKCNDSLFERFVKVDEFTPGMGLGLSICRTLAMTLDGDVGLESTLGKGSVFWVELKK